MKPEHGVGQPPMAGALGNWPMMHYLKEAGVPYSRLSDVGGWLGGGLYVDIPNLFPDFDADESNPENYRFAYTDSLVKVLVDNGVEPYFRLGVTIENFAARGFPPLRISPPKDFAKWARICERVVRHYTEGWADGFRYRIVYWEIWNEPDFVTDESPMWAGTFEEYCKLYEVAAKHLKALFPHLKIGGYGSSGLAKLVQKTMHRPHDHHTMQCMDDFLRFAKERSCPLDFFSIHAYDMPEAPLVPSSMRTYAKYCREKLDEAGYTATELSMNEWLPRWSKPGSARQAALCASLLIALQDSAFDNAMIYDAEVGVGLYSPLFDPSTMKPRLAYWALCNFNELYRLGTQVVADGAPEGVNAIAATDGKAVGKLFAANIGTAPAAFEVSSPGWRLLSFQVTDEDHVNTVLPVFGSAITLPADSFGVATFIRERP